jgi:hypothetical protein
MAVANRSATTNITYTSRTNTVITAPGTIVNGDVLLIYFIIGATGAPPTPTAPAGFTLASGYPHTTGPDTNNFEVVHYLWTKTASGESGNYTITHAVASTQAYMASYSGGDTATSLSPAPTFNSGVNSSTTTALGLTTPRDGSMIIFISQDWGDTTNTLVAPTGTTPTFTKQMWVNPGLLLVADGALSPAGATGNKTITNNNTGVNSYWAGILICIQAANPIVQAVSPIQIKRSNTAASVPSSLNQGELALNMPDQKLYTANTSAVFQIKNIGPNTAVSFNDSTYIGGVPGFTFNKATNNVTIANNLTNSANAFNLGSASPAANGFTFLPNGILLQWGWRAANSTSAFISFPVSFPTTCFSVVAVSNTGASGNKTFVPGITQQNTSGCTILTSNATASNVHWIAVGN